MKFLYKLIFNEIYIFSFNKTALHIAAECGSIEIVNLLLKQKDINVNIEDGIFNVIFFQIKFSF